MNAPRRCVRRVSRPADRDPRRLRQALRQQEVLAKERAGLARWMARLKRAFHTMEKSQARIARLERSLLRLEQG